jgi:hypothetical protein
MGFEKIKYYIKPNGLYSTFAWEITKCEGHYDVYGNFTIDNEEIIANFNTYEEAEVYLKLHDMKYDR